MPVLHFTTYINAPVERCFDLSRSIDLHILSTSQTHETAVGGVTRGLIGLNERVTWRAKHFGIYQHLTSEITAYEYPFFFESSMVKGAFKKIHHRHIFKTEGDITIMEDQFDFEAPFGWLGKLVSKWVLASYMKRLLATRNNLIREVAESEKWKSVLTL